MFLKEQGSELEERAGRRPILERTKDGEAFVDLKGEDAGAVPVSGLEAIGEWLVVEESRELEDVGAGDGETGDEHRQHGALPSSRIVAGSAAGSPEITSVAA